MFRERVLAGERKRLFIRFAKIAVKERIMQALKSGVDNQNFSMGFFGSSELCDSGSIYHQALLYSSSHITVMNLQLRNLFSLILSGPFSIVFYQ